MAAAVHVAQKLAAAADELTNAPAQESVSGLEQPRTAMGSAAAVKRNERMVATEM